MNKASVVFVCFLLSVVATSADLQSDFEDIANHLPIQEIKSIAKKYEAKNPQFGEFFRNFHKLVENFFLSRDGQQLVEYFNRKGIDFKGVILSYLNVISRKWMESVEQAETEISGSFYADCQKAIHSSKVRAVIMEKLKSSSEFQNFVAALKDPKFGPLLFRAIHSNGNGFDQGKLRGFWQNVWNVIGAVAVGMVMFG